MKNSTTIDLNNTDSILEFIIKNKPGDIQYKMNDIIKKEINEIPITKISNIYSNIKLNIDWTDEKYKSLLIQNVLEDIFFSDLINYFMFLNKE